PAGESRGEGARDGDSLNFPGGPSSPVSPAGHHLDREPPHPNPLPEGEGNGSAPAPLRSTSAIQLHNSYLVAESDDGLIIIDQHALHERIMFEELSARLARGPLESQRMLLPITVAASQRQMAMLEQIQPLLARLGIELSSFGPEAVAIHAFPSFLEKLDPAEFV